MFSNIKSTHLRRNLKQNIMKRIHQNHLRKGIFYVPDRAIRPFSVIHDSERCVLTTVHA